MPGRGGDFSPLQTTTLYELLKEINTPDRTVISIEDLLEYEETASAASAGMHSLRDDGFAKAREGVTSVAEVLRVLGS